MDESPYRYCNLSLCKTKKKKKKKQRKKEKKEHRPPVDSENFDQWQNSSPLDKDTLPAAHSVPHDPPNDVASSHTPLEHLQHRMKKKNHKERSRHFLTSLNHEPRRLKRLTHSVKKIPKN